MNKYAAVMLLALSATVAACGRGAGTTSPPTTSPTIAPGALATAVASPAADTPLAGTAASGLPTPLGQGTYFGAFSAEYAKIATAVQSTIGILQNQFDPHDSVKVAALREQFHIIREQYANILQLVAPPQYLEMQRAFVDAQAEYALYMTSFEEYLDTGKQEALDAAAAHLQASSAKQVIARRLLQSATQPH